jgi:hypothetical protein
MCESRILTTFVNVNQPPQLYGSASINHLGYINVYMTVDYLSANDLNRAFSENVTENYVRISYDTVCYRISEAIFGPCHTQGLSLFQSIGVCVHVAALFIVPFVQYNQLSKPPSHLQDVLCPTKLYRKPHNCGMTRAVGAFWRIQQLKLDVAHIRRHTRRHT